MLVTRGAGISVFLSQVEDNNLPGSSQQDRRVALAMVPMAKMDIQNAPLEIPNASGQWTVAARCANARA